MGTALAQAAGRKAGTVPSVTHDIEALFAELSRRPQDAPGQGLTSAELRAKLDLSLPGVTAFIKAAMAAGRCRCVKKVQKAMDGRLARVPAYVFEG